MSHCKELLVSHLNFLKSEVDALKLIDAMRLDDAISRCVENRSRLELIPFRLDLCGDYVARRAREFDSTLQAFAVAKASKKTEATHYAALKAGSALSSAFRQTQVALQQEIQDAELFRVYDDMMPPGRLAAAMSIRITYQWRASAGDAWTRGDIVFAHTVVPRVNYLAPVPKRKPSTAERERKLQDDLYTEWEHLKRLALSSLRKHFRDGGSAATVPKVFPVVLDSYNGQLNNHSTDFWREH